jgi:hypothetical protein
MNETPIPCLFKYFDEIKEWSKGYAFLSSECKIDSYISLTPYPLDIKWYCYGIDNPGRSGCVWIPDSPVIKELYEI